MSKPKAVLCPECGAPIQHRQGRGRSRETCSVKCAESRHKKQKRMNSRFTSAQKFSETNSPYR